MMRRVHSSRLADHQFLRTKEGLDVFRDRATGELPYVDRTQRGAPPGRISSAAIQDRFTSLADELIRLGAFAGALAGDHQGDSAALHQRAKQLVEDTQASEPGPLHLQGIAARLLTQWEEAVPLFRPVTAMSPEYPDGWLELTCAPASLRRFAEAALAARKAVDLAPGRADALGNLAAVVVGQGRPNGALRMAEKALAADSTDARNSAVLLAAKKAVSERTPWWRRLLGRPLNDVD